MTYRGVYRDGIVILEGEVDLRNGATVEVNPAATPHDRGCIAPRKAKQSKPLKPTARKPKKADLPLPGFGAWKHRADITDTAEFARQLRKRVSRREPRR